MRKLFSLFLTLFPLWVILAAIAGLSNPELLTSMSAWIVPLLVGVMLCMGLTLSINDFIKISQHKGALLLGLVLQFSVMPCIAFVVSLAFGFSPEVTAGMVLLGSVAGGTASNVMTLIAGGNVALSVSMTAFSTIFSIILTPLLLLFWIGSTVEVQATAMLINLFKIVLIPVAAGVLINNFFNGAVKRIELALAPIAVVLIVVIIAIVIALNANRISDGALAIGIATLIHNVAGLIIGYIVARLFRYDSVVARTIAIEVGMQNSGLATVLALKFFSPLAALPGAMFSIWLNITGSIFAYLCTRSDMKNQSDSDLGEAS
ncbi:MAG: bile acid:sodium symporter family protein [Pseudomonadota bacterium]